MKLLAVLFISVIIPSILAAGCTKESAKMMFRRAVSEYSTSLMARIAVEKENHFITSAFSSWSLIAAVSLGASDRTLAEIRQLLRIPSHLCFAKKMFELIKEIEAVSDGVTAERSSGIFIDDKMIVKDEFLNKIRRANVSDIEVINTDDTLTAANFINNYVKEATRGNINEIITPEDMETVFMVLVDAIYFKGAWKHPFSSIETEISSFYNHKGEPIGDVNLMFTSNEFNMSHVDQIKSFVIDIPYGSNGRFSMLIILPDKDVTIAETLDALPSVSLHSIFGLLRPITVSLQLPRFEMKTNVDNLKELLEDMGLRNMFDPTRASFPDIASFPVYVSNVIQKATIKVTEEGTEATVATELGFSYRSFPAEFTVNRPFIFMIVDKYTELTLFSGVYSKPSVY